MLLKLILVDVATPNLASLSTLLKKSTGYKLDVPVNGSPLANYLDSLNDDSMALDSVIIHVLAIGDTAGILQAAILMQASFLPFGNNAALLTLSLQQAHDYVVLNTRESNPGKLVTELYSIIKPLGILDDYTIQNDHDGLKLLH